jgi:hypothetical protein
VKFDASGTLLWQKVWDNASGDAVTVAPDGSVYAAATAPRPGGLAEFDVVTLKITSGGGLEWARAYQAGLVVDARGGMAAAPDSGSIAIAGAIQARAGGGVVDLAALLLKIDADGNLVFEREYGGKVPFLTRCSHSTMPTSGPSSTFDHRCTPRSPRYRLSGAPPA